MTASAPAPSNDGAGVWVQLLAGAHDTCPERATSGLLLLLSPRRLPPLLLLLLRGGALLLLPLLLLRLLRRALAILRRGLPAPWLLPPLLLLWRPRLPPLRVPRRGARATPRRRP